jgi:pyruvate dehydrogenase E1 component alpha subunit
MTCTYRGHGAVLAMGAPLAETFGEIFGKARGLCGGKGGSMHLADKRVGALGAHAIVGAHLPIANGAAFAATYRNTGAVHVCFFGDGSTNIGAFHESLNLASIWTLPVVFVCENNLYGEYSPVALTTPIERLADRAASYGMPGERIDGNSVLEVRAAVAAAVERARAGEGPTLIEAMTYRQKGHSRTDPAKYRPEGELEDWLERDPILLHERALAAGGVEQEELERVRETAREAVAAARERALAWPEPEPAALYDSVWVER